MSFFSFFSVVLLIFFKNKNINSSFNLCQSQRSWRQSKQGGEERVVYTLEYATVQTQQPFIHTFRLKVNLK